MSDLRCHSYASIMKNPIVAGNIYHILTRGVDKRKIFIDDQDYLRFIHDLFGFNDEKPVINMSRSFRRGVGMSDIVSPSVAKRELLVDILAFCLMPNHYHILLRPKSDEGATKFIRKLNIGYVKYFNEKYKRSGALFEGRFKRILISDDAHFTYLPYYIHLNPLDLIMPEWRDGKISDCKKAMNFLENYRWSSFPDYIGKKNFPSVTQRKFLMDCFGGAERQKAGMINWLKEMEADDIKDIVLE